MEMDDSVSTRTSRLVLLALGSQDPRWQRPFVHLWLKLNEKLGEGSVRLAFLENSQPTLLEVAQEAVNDGLSDITVLPLFLALGDQIEQEIPRQVVHIKERFSNLGVVLLPPIGEHPTVADAIYTVAKASCT